MIGKLRLLQALSAVEDCAQEWDSEAESEIDHTQQRELRKKASALSDAVVRARDGTQTIISSTVQNVPS